MRRGKRKDEDVSDAESEQDEERAPGFSDFGATDGPRINSCFNLNKVYNVISSFRGEKKRLVESIGFGGLLSIQKQDRISRRLALWLLSRFDPASSCLVLDKGVKLSISDYDVKLVLGLPDACSSKLRPSTAVSLAMNIVKGILKLSRTAEITLDYVESLLVKEYEGKMSIKDKEAFKVAVVLFVDAYLFSPSSGQAKINNSVCPYLVNPNSIDKVNWSAYVLRAVKEASRKVKKSLASGNKSVSLDCCLILLQIFYLDNLQSNVCDESYLTLPRIADYTFERMKRMISEDKHDRGKIYGKLKVRPAEQVIYSRSGKNIATISSCSEQAAQHEMGVSYVTLKLQELKAEFDECTRVYRENVDKLFVEFESSISGCDKDYCARTLQDEADLSITSTTTFNVLDGDLASTPICRVKYVDSPSANGSRTCISVESSSPAGSIANSDYGGFSMGPTFDKSATREPEKVLDCLFSLDHSPIGGKSPGISEVSEALSKCTFAENDLYPKQYPVSPFNLMLDEPTQSKRSIMTLVNCLPIMCDEDKKRVWFIHDTPSNITIDGSKLHREFTTSDDFSETVVDAFVRLFIQKDDIMYTGETEKRWRHFLPSTWSGLIMKRGKYAWEHRARNMFSGSHLSYCVADCRMVFAPVLFECTWSCYIWDFEKNVVVVFDPTLAYVDKAIVVEKHNNTVKRLNEGMEYYMKMFAGYDGVIKSWSADYITIKDAQCGSGDSGLLSLFCSRVYDGDSIGILMPNDRLPFMRAKFLYQLLMMTGNMRHPPRVLEEPF